MIYTLTFSPSIDYFIKVKDFESGKINRAENYKFVVGGKGINVSLILNDLKQISTAIVVYGGEVGKTILNDLKEKNIPTIGIPVDGESRVNVKISSSSETAINLPSPKMDENSFNNLLKEIENIPSESILVISGRLKGIISIDMANTLMKITLKNKLKVILDISDSEYVSMLNYQSVLIKPNYEELGILSNIEIKDATDMISINKACEKLSNLGVKRILVSLGRLGAYYYENRLENFFIQTHQVNTHNTVGAGDSLLGAFIFYYAETKNSRHSLQKAVDYVARKLYKNSLDD